MRTWLAVSWAMCVCACTAAGPSADSGPPLAIPPPPGAPPGPSGANAGPELPLAAGLPAQCAGPEIARIDRPVAAANPSLGHYRYGFRFRAPTAPGAPVLVFLPGGPGLTSTDQVPSFVPAGWGYLLTDPRGVGCNTLATLPADDVASAFFRSEEIAGDVVAAIGDRRLDDYVLFGISYGTILATIAAPALEARGSAPRAVVLEGVVGRALRRDEYAGAETIVQWNNVRAALPADVLAELDTQPSPYGITPEGWTHALTTLLAAGPDIVTKMVGDIPATGPGLLRPLADTPLLTDPQAVALYRWVACREIDDTAPTGDLDPLFSRGLLVRNTAQEGTKCAGLHVTAPYDSGAYPFSTQAYYFVGDADVDTPPWQAAYHFEHHTGHVVRIVTKGAGHLSLEIDQSACARDVLTSIAGGGADLERVLASCPRPVTVDEK